MPPNCQTAVRTVERDNLIWFVASDIAKALSYRNADDMTRVLDEDERGTHIVRTVTTNQHGVTSEQDNTVIVINESGLYHALIKSRKPEAVPFRKWVTGEVLTSFNNLPAAAPADFGLNPAVTAAFVRTVTGQT